MAGVAADEEVGQFVDHLAQHAGAAIVEREDQVFADNAIVAVHENQNAAEAVDLAERAADRLGERHDDLAGHHPDDLHE